MASNGRAHLLPTQPANRAPDRAWRRAQLGALCSLVALTSACPGGCTGIDVGNPVDVSFTIYDEASADFTVTDLWLVVDEVRFYSCAQQQVTASAPGPLYIDVFAGGAPGPLGGLDVPEDNYCVVELAWGTGGPPLPGGVPAELDGVTVLLGGVRADGKTFTVRSRRQDALMQFALAPQGFTVDADTTTLFEGYSGQNLLGGLDLNSAVVMGNSFRIETGTNDALLDLFEAGFHSATALYDDSDGNGVLDPGERQTPLAFGQ